MRLNRPASLGKTVEAIASSRPIKVAYLVPFDDPETAHRILDAVFFESYTRWAGVYTLIVPTREGRFHDESFRDWLGHFDPDFLYAYSEIEASFLEIIDHTCCPIVFLMHDLKSQEAEVDDWRKYLPRFQHYFKSISSISTVQSPEIHLRVRREDPSRELTIFTQYQSMPTSRFLADNFGVSFDLHTITHARPGLFRTLCLVPAGLPENNIAGSEVCTSVVDAFKAIVDRQATPISQLAMAHSEGVARIEAASWASSFRIFVGDSPLDRINFWNCRHLQGSWNRAANSLIIDESFFRDDSLVHQLGQYLNNNNFLGGGGGPHRVSIHSAGISKDALMGLRDALQPLTWNSVAVEASFDALAVPNKRDIERCFHQIQDATSLKISEDFAKIRASEPAHLSYLAPQIKALGRGQWMVELIINRHNDLSKYVNVIDAWKLPRRRWVASAFTERLARPTRSGRLALLPASNGYYFGGALASEPSYYEIFLPSDEDFFRRLVLDFFRYPEDDMRSGLPRHGYVDMSISDKGQNLRGVIAMFGDLSTASGVLTNAYWRHVLDIASLDSSRPRTFDMDKLRSLVIDNNDVVDRAKFEQRFESIKETKKYLHAGLLDTLENLIRANVFFQVSNWRCKYCGHLNSRTFDRMKIRNECDICATAYMAPIDIKWAYELNDFVHRSLKRHGGLYVLWTLGFLFGRLHAGSFWYLPEVDLYLDDDNDKKNEIDILCMVDGAFHVIEVKRSATTFLNAPDALDKFCNIILRLRPDIALLSFGQYCSPGEDEAETKERLHAAAQQIRTKIAPWTKLEILVAQDTPEFNGVPVDLGWRGPRVSELDWKRAQVG